MANYDQDSGAATVEVAFASGMWIYPGLILTAASPGGTIRVVAGLKRRDGWVWPGVFPSHNFPPLVWVDTVTVYSSGRREVTSEILGDYLRQVRCGQRLPNVDYASVMAIRVVRQPELALQSAPVIQVVLKPAPESNAAAGVF